MISSASKDSDQYKHIVVFPNPSSGGVYVDGLKGEINFELFDMKGALIDSGILDSNILSIQNTGLYTLKLNVADGWISRKVVIER